jgi:SAM-dependent methyltransferase
MTYRSIASHRSMALDARRNAAYAAALRHSVGPESIVLDLGAGTGIHGLIAARLGARRVYLVEPEDIIAVARDSVRANHLEDTVQCIQGQIEEIPRPEPVDIIVSALTGNFLLTEDLLPSLFVARDRWLKPGGVLIPDRATMEGVPVSAPVVFDREIASWSEPNQGIDLSPARAYAANTVWYSGKDLRDTTFLAEPLPLLTLDFLRDGYDRVHAEVTYEVAQSGICHGWLGWFTMRLGDAWLSTSPREEPVHWSSALLPVDPPLVCERGERLTFALDRVPFGDWTWSVTVRSTVQRHSTFLSTPITAATLHKASLDYRPTLAEDGRALIDVLSACDGLTSVTSMAQTLQDRYPQRYPTRDAALRFVQNIVKQYS